MFGYLVTAFATCIGICIRTILNPYFHIVKPGVFSNSNFGVGQTLNNLLAAFHNGLLLPVLMLLSYLGVNCMRWPFVIVMTLWQIFDVVIFFLLANPTGNSLGSNVGLASIIERSLTILAIFAVMIIDSEMMFHNMLVWGFASYRLVDAFTKNFLFSYNFTFFSSLTTEILNIANFITLYVISILLAFTGETMITATLGGLYILYFMGYLLLRVYDDRGFIV